MRIIHNERLLIIDNDEQMCRTLQLSFTNEGYDMDIAHSPKQALTMMSDNIYSLVFTDAVMDGILDFSIISELELNIPFVFITSKNSEKDILEGFQKGAEDYISKPFLTKEVIARTQAILKRTKPNFVISERKVIEIDDLKIDLIEKRVSILGQDIQLTKKEFRILILLASTPNKRFTREDILTQIWANDTDVLNRTIDVHIARLRRKIGIYGSKIISRTNYGYYFNA